MFNQLSYFVGKILLCSLIVGIPLYLAFYLGVNVAERNLVAQKLKSCSQGFNVGVEILTQGQMLPPPEVSRKVCKELLKPKNPITVVEE